MSKRDVPFRGGYLVSADQNLAAPARPGRVYARATIPPEAAYLPLSRCIECKNTLLPGDKVYADISGDLYPPPMLCRTDGQRHRSRYTFASDAEDWETTTDE